MIMRNKEKKEKMEKMEKRKKGQKGQKQQNSKKRICNASALYNQKKRRENIYTPDNKNEENKEKYIEKQQRNRGLIVYIGIYI